MKSTTAVKLCLCFLALGYPLKAEIEERTETTLSEIVKEKQLSNARRAEESGIGNISDEKKRVFQAMRDYNQSQSSEALSILSEILSPDSESDLSFTVAKNIELDRSTYPILRKFIAESRSRDRAMAIGRLKFAPFALDMNATEVAELIGFLENIAGNVNDPDLRVPAAAGIMVSQLKENPYIETTESIRKRMRQAELVEEPITEVAPAPPVEEVPEVIEEVTAPEPVIEEPAEVVVSEPVEEDIEPSSNWWLWLIGAVVVVGGIFVLRSRK